MFCASLTFPADFSFVKDKTKKQPIRSFFRKSRLLGLNDIEVFNFWYYTYFLNFLLLSENYVRHSMHVNDGIYLVIMKNYDQNIKIRLSIAIDTVDSLYGAVITQ